MIGLASVAATRMHRDFHECVDFATRTKPLMADIRKNGSTAQAWCIAVSNRSANGEQFKQNFYALGYTTMLAQRGRR
jgi:hypothetical protein